MSSQSDVKVIICYLLDRLHRDVTMEQLGIICESVGIDYFLLTGAVDDLIGSGALIQTETGLVLGDNGRMSSEYFSRYLPLVFRKRILTAALEFFSSAGGIPGCICEAVTNDSGCFVHFSLGGSDGAIDMHLLAGDSTQAERMAENIRKAPIQSYERIIAALLADNTPQINVDQII